MNNPKRSIVGKRPPGGSAVSSNGERGPAENNGEREDSRQIEDLVFRLLALLGEDPRREGLVNTPARVERALRYFTSGYHQDVDDVLNGALFPIEYNEMVIVRDIDFYSLCEHHLLPFFGKCHVAYLPNKKIIGLSKLPRLVEMFSRRLQVQERLTQQIADTIQDRIDPFGVAVVIEGQHLCTMMRGVEKQNALAVTSAMLGTFKADYKARAEFLNLIHRRPS
ncbi:MAG: GTP cyclohydrolase I FolE [Nitrospirota bacterium]